MERLLSSDPNRHSRIPLREDILLASDRRDQGRSLLGWAVKYSNPDGALACLDAGLLPSLATDPRVHYTVLPFDDEFRDAMGALCVPPITSIPDMLAWEALAVRLAGLGVPPPVLEKPRSWLAAVLERAGASFDAFLLEKSLPDPQDVPSARRPSV